MLDTRIRAADYEANRRSNGAVHADEPRAANHQDSVKTTVAGLEACLARTSFDASDSSALGAMLKQMVEAGHDRLPLPGSGRTLVRWQMLAAVAARDLGLVKLFEGHTDALAILAELDALAASTVPVGSRWAVWAAEPPDARVTAMPQEGEVVRLDGTKAWCSGAQSVSHALITAWLGDEPVLVAVNLDQASISISTAHWQAVGMRATASGDVHFEGTRAVLVGKPHDYVRRPGFWQGGAGIAACWYGAAANMARMTADAIAAKPDPHRLAHLGAMDVALAGAAAVLRATAAQIDADPAGDVHVATLRARLAVEAAATSVMDHAGRALGAAPLCRDERFARAMADLPVFLRQSHAERDLAALADRLLAERKAERTAEGDAWKL